MSGSGSRWVALALAVGLQTGRPLDRFVPRLVDAEAQLDHARRLKLEMYRHSPEKRPFWRKLAVEAYQAVPAFHPEDRSRAAEALFRAGELARSGGDAAGALDLFEEAARWEAGDFSARATLEVGHLHRRAGRNRKALDAYLEVAGDARAAAHRRDDAWIWAGVVWWDQGRAEDARRAWRRVADRGERGVDRIRAFDRLGCSWLENGDPEAACGVLDECLRALSQSALEETENGERVRNALLRMRLVDGLRKAVAERKRSRVPTGTSRKS